LYTTRGHRPADYLLITLITSTGNGWPVAG